MTLKEAIANRIIGLCKEHTIAPNELANRAGVNPSTVYSILGTKSKRPEVATIKKICDAFETPWVNSSLWRNSTVWNKKLNNKKS